MEMTSEVLVIGFGQAFEMAREISKGDSRFHLMEIKSANGFDYDLSFLDEFDRGKFACTVALDSYAVNFLRMGALLKVSEKGFVFASLVSRYSAINERAQIQKGVIIGPNSIVHDGATIGYGAMIHAGVIVGSGTIIKPHACILDGAQLGSGCKIGLGSTIGPGVILSDGTTVGRHCELLRPVAYSGTIKDRTFQDSLFPEGLVIRDFN